MEGLAMVLFLLTLYFILRAMVAKESTGKQNINDLLYAVLFANLAIYTHERYIVLFPFIILVALFYPLSNKLSSIQKAGVCALAVLSMAINVVIKKYIYGFSFFMGTADQEIHPSYSQALGFLRDGLLSIVQLNSGPEGISGMNYTELSRPYKFLLLLIGGALLLLLVMYLINVRRAYKYKEVRGMDSFRIILFLSILFGLCILPAIVTIRLEQRWLQASFSVFILIVVIAFCNIRTRHTLAKNLGFCMFVLLFVISDRNYLVKAREHVFFKYAEWMADEYKEAIFHGVIRPGTENIFIYDKRKDTEHEWTTNWILANGYNFEFYQGKSKNILFLDSTVFTNKEQLIHFNKNKDQIVSFQGNVIDITDQILAEAKVSGK
jgi:hypothetical protein